MRPLAVLIAIVTGSAVSLAVGLLMTGAVLLLMPAHTEQFVAEKGPLLQAILLFTLLSGASGAALYGELRRRQWRLDGDSRLGDGSSPRDSQLRPRS